MNCEQDTIMTSEALGMKTTAGAAVFHDMRAKKNAGIVDRVRLPTFRPLHLG